MGLLQEPGAVAEADRAGAEPAEKRRASVSGPARQRCPRWLHSCPVSAAARRELSPR